LYLLKKRKTRITMRSFRLFLVLLSVVVTLYNISIGEYGIALLAFVFALMELYLANTQK
jgi:membrane associated rhomboid family serine protease